MRSPHYRAVIADDDADIRLLTRRYLDRSGRFTVVAEAGDGQQAIEAAQEHQPDVTLLDLLMPDTDGLTALSHIRTVAPGTTVIVVSGMGQPEIREGVMAAGAAGFVEKQSLWDGFVDDLLRLLEEAPGEDNWAGALGHLAADRQRRQLDISSGLESGRAARRFIREALAEWGVEHLSDDAELLTSELVNNAVVHAESAVRLLVLFDDRRLRVEVCDTGAGALHIRHTEITDDGGRGLFLVDALSRSWGTSADEAGKSVWFELEAQAT